MTFPAFEPAAGVECPRADYVRKFRTLTEVAVSPREVERFLGVAQRLPDLASPALAESNLALPAGLACAVRDERGIF